MAGGDASGSVPGNEQLVDVDPNAGGFRNPPPGESFMDWLRRKRWELIGGGAQTPTLEPPAAPPYQGRQMFYTDGRPPDSSPYYETIPAEAQMRWDEMVKRMAQAGQR